MPVVSYHVGSLSGLLTPFATFRSLLEAGGSTSKTLNGGRGGFRNSEGRCKGPPLAAVVRGTPLFGVGRDQNHLTDFPLLVCSLLRAWLLAGGGGRFPQLFGMFG
jgi:hypothetical protein